VIARDGQEMEEQRHESLERRIDAPGVGDNLFERLGVGVALAQRETPAQAIDEREIRGVAAVGLAPALGDGDLLAIQLAAELVEQAALADARLAFHGDELAFAGEGLGDQGPHRLELRVAADVALEAALARRLEARMDGGRTQDAMGYDGQRLALHD